MATGELPGTGSGGVGGQGYEPGDVRGPVAWTRALEARLTDRHGPGPDEWMANQMPCERAGEDDPQSITRERETHYSDDTHLTVDGVSERTFTYDARGRRVRTDELAEIDGVWIPWRSTLHPYEECD